MKTTTLLIAFLLFTMAAISQQLIEEKKVPAAVMSTFKKKASGATDVKWFQQDHNFIAKYTTGEYPAEMHFTREGVITLTKTGIDPDKLPDVIKGELAKEHRGKKIHEVFLVVKSKKEKYYSIILHEKQGRKQAPLVWEAQYTMQGKLITIYEPTVEETPEETPQEVRTKFTEDVDEEMDDLKEKVKDEKISRKDLPSAAEEYLSEHFDYEYRAKDVIVKSNSKYGQYYYVVMKKQGEKKEHIILFDFKGNLISHKEVDL